MRGLRPCRWGSTIALSRDWAGRQRLAHRARGLGPRLALGEKHGYRNAQASVHRADRHHRPLMDCDTTGIEPDFALVKFKKLAGGGYFKIVNQSLPPALRNLGYSQTQIDEILRLRHGHTSRSRARPHINRDSLKAGLHR